MPFNPDKQLTVEIYSNCPSNSMGYTIWHIKGKDKKVTISRNADGKDLDWLSEKEMKRFEAGEFKFKMPAQYALDTFSYMY